MELDLFETPSTSEIRRQKLSTMNVDFLFDDGMDGFS